MVGTLGALGAGAAGGAVVSVVIRAVDEATGVMKDVNTTMLALGGAITGIGVAGAGAVGGLVKVAGEFEQTQIAFTTMLGSADEANKLLKDLSDFAVKTPFEITGIEQNAKQLLAMGIETDELIPTLKSLGDISAGLNVPLERLALNYGQVATQGKLTGKELKDFTVAGVPLIEELSRTLGVSKSEIQDMVSKGDIGFEQLKAAFESMTGEGGRFFDLMDAQSKTFLGQVGNIKDSFTKVGRTMGEIFLPAATKVAEVLGKIVAWMEEHPKFTKFAAIVLAIGTGLALVIGPLLMMVALLPAIAAGIGIITGVSSPWLLIIGAIVAAIAAVIAIGYLLIKHWDDIKAAASAVWDWIKDTWNAGVDFIKGVVKLIANAYIGMGNAVINVWNGIIDAVAAGINWVISGINKVISSINKVPGVNLPTLGQATLSWAKIANIPYLAKGGIVTDPTLAMIGERGPEAVVPLNNNNGYGDIYLTIEGNVYGTDPDDIADALMRELKMRIGV